MPRKRLGKRWAFRRHQPCCATTPDRHAIRGVFPKQKILFHVGSHCDCFVIDVCDSHGCHCDCVCVASAFVVGVVLYATLTYRPTPKNMTFCRPSTVRLLGLHSIVSYIVLVAITCPEVCTKCVCVRNQESWWCDMFARSCCVLSHRICNFPCRHGLIYCGRRERMQNMHGARLSTQPSNCWCLRFVVGKLHKFS